MYFKNLNYLNSVKNLNYRFNARFKKNKISYKRTLSYSIPIIYIHVPFQWQFVLLEKNFVKRIYFYSQIYYIWTVVPFYSDRLFFDTNTHTLKLINLYTNNYTKLYLNYFNRFIISFINTHFIKLKFKGKGYYIFKNKRNTITPQFGYSHRHYVYGYFNIVKFRSKTSILILSISYINIVYYSFLIKALRPINIFTGRGVRFNKEIIFKKVGKVSSYR